MTALTGTMAALAMLVQGGLCGPAIQGEDLLTSPIVLLGETHGTREIPAAFAGLVCRAASAKPGESVLVGLEILSGAQSSLETFLGSDGSDAARQEMLKGEFWQRQYQDGRSSGAMADLLSALHGYCKAGLKIVVLAIDEKDAPSGQRDARMASAIEQGLEAHHPGRTFILVGDVHSRMLKGYPWNASADYLPLGAQLKSKHAEALGLSVKAARGTAWVCLSGAASECGPKTAKSFELSGTTPRVTLDPEAAAKTGWSGTLYLAELTASPPAGLPPHP